MPSDPQITEIRRELRVAAGILARNPEYRLKRNLRSRLQQALHGRAKSAGLMELLGMKIKEFKIYLQGQFASGISWSNYGPVWQVDHIRPCASFDLTDPAQQRECFHWSNCQPLFVIDNLKKGDRYVPN